MNSVSCDSEHVVIGKVGAPHGVSGEVRVFSFTEPLANIMDFENFHLRSKSVAGNEKSWSPVTIDKIHRHKSFFVVRFSGVNDRDAASSLTHSELSVLRTDLAELDDDDVYWNDLIGACVYNQECVSLGIVKGFMETGANDVLVVRNTDGKEHLVPYVEQFVLDVDTNENRVVVDWDPDF